MTYKKSNEDEIERKIQFHKLFRIKQIEIKRKWTKSEKKKNKLKGYFKMSRGKRGNREERGNKERNKWSQVWNLRFFCHMHHLRMKEIHGN